MKTRPNHAPGSKEMREMVAALSPAERASLEDPNFITEDEAEIILAERAMNEPGRSIPLEEILKEFGQQPRRRRTA
jgi:hypothetical protein